MTGLGWLVATFGLGGAALILAAVVLGWPVVLTFLSTRLGRWLLGALSLGGAVLVGLAALYRKGRDDGVTAAQTQQKESDDDFMEQLHRRDGAIDDLSDDDLDRLLHDSREPGAG
jgi:hypothetical protein